MARRANIVFISQKSQEVSEGHVYLFCLRLASHQVCAPLKELLAILIYMGERSELGAQARIFGDLILLFQLLELSSRFRKGSKRRARILHLGYQCLFTLHLLPKGETEPTDEREGVREEDEPPRPALEKSCKYRHSSVHSYLS